MTCGRTWAYLAVMLICEWPRISITLRISTPWASSRLPPRGAGPRRSSCGQTGGGESTHELAVAHPVVPGVPELAGEDEVADRLHRLERAASAAHHQRAVAEDAAEDALVDIDALDLGPIHFNGMAGEDAALEDDALVGDGDGVHPRCG